LQPEGTMPVFAGTVVSLVIDAILTQLGIALGLTKGASAAYWAVLAPAISLYGGCYAGGLSLRGVPTFAGWVRGLIVAGLFFFLTQGSGLVRFSADSSLRHGDPRAFETANSLFSDWMAPGAVRALADQVVSGDIEGARLFLSNKTHRPPIAVNARLLALQRAFVNLESDESVTRAYAAAQTLAMLTLGALLAVIGGADGARTAIRRTQAEVAHPKRESRAA
jgi:hypothetical protein